MRLLIQRVSSASVTVDNQQVAAIGPGALIFIGVTHGDTAEKGEWLANKCVNLRIFEDSESKMNRSLLDQKFEVLVVSQFTLYADCRAGRRPSFTDAAMPELAKHLYEKFIDAVKKFDLSVQSGIFGATMKVSLVNDGPVTLFLEQ